MTGVFATSLCRLGYECFYNSKEGKKEKEKSTLGKLLNQSAKPSFFFQPPCRSFPWNCLHKLSKLSKCAASFFFFFFFLSGFSFTKIHESQDCRGRAGISLTPFYHFHPLHRHLGISRAIATESSPLHIASRRTLVSLSSHW